MKKLAILFFSFALIILLQGVYTGSAFASTYDPSGDTTVNVSTPLISTSALDPVTTTTSNATFNIQETLQNSVTNTTGLQVTHSYVWMNVNGAPVLAVDPPRPMF